MSKPTDIRIVEAVLSFESVPYRTPLKFGGRVVDHAILVNVEVSAESRRGHGASGFGTMPLGTAWAWPTPALSVEQAEDAMRKFAEDVVELANGYPDYGHPIEIAYQLSAEYPHTAKTLAQRLKLAEEMPLLAQLVAASAFDAALHDAFGRANDMNSFDGLSSKQMNDDLSIYLDAQFKGEFLDKYTLRQPKPALPLYHLVGALDPLTAADVKQPVRDGLPESLADWIKADGLTHLKIKLAGDNLDWDVERTLAVDRVAVESAAAKGKTALSYSCDFNEKCPNAAYVVDFLNRIKKQSGAAFDRIQYIEQPTHRNLREHPNDKMHEAAKLKPIVIDESLVDYDTLMLARDMGYTGVALKTCKGQTDSLLLAAAAQKFNMFLCVQDLTCPGASFLQSASLAARIPTVAAVEGNSRQYCPQANKLWAKKYPGLFKVTDGQVATGVLNKIGLGF
jgi:L-alanine-DL-glutamate epimerase-like enolase superfamily enzyme